MTDRTTSVGGADSRHLLRQPIFRHGFLLIFTTFFSFAALLNVLPFSLVVYLINDVYLLIIFSFINASGFFLLHATLSSFLNSQLPAQSGRVNGWYISIYYAAGALGSWIPVILFTRYGWLPFLSLVALVRASGLFPLRRLSQLR